MNSLKIELAYTDIYTANNFGVERIGVYRVQNEEPTKRNARRSRRWLDKEPIGIALQKTYEDVTAEPAPERLTSLLEKLREKAGDD